MLSLYSICFIQKGSDGVHNRLTEATGVLAAALLDLDQNCWQATSMQLVISHLWQPQTKYVNGWVDRIHKEKAQGRASLSVSHWEYIWLWWKISFCERENNVFSWPNSKHAAGVTQKVQLLSDKNLTKKSEIECSLNNKPHSKKSENSLLMFFRGATVKVKRRAGFSMVQ